MPIKFSLFILYFILLIPVNAQQAEIYATFSTLNIDELRAIDDVKSAGKILIDQELGWIKISDDKITKSDTTVIFVHGYGSTGYEWIMPIFEINNSGYDTYFYRYNWNICPDSVASILHSTIPDEIHDTGKVVLIFGHSFGGLVVTYLGTKLGETDQQIEIHTIAAPLAGYDRLNQMCGNESSIFEWSSYYAEDNEVISHFQWRTQQQQDGAFQELPVDPQKVNIPKSTVIELPATMDGHRLGHNWSITWVIKEYLN
ncbi:esterase/lipase family protein [Candidatus Neomarinimicrobiota bacterium]